MSDLNRLSFLKDQRNELESLIAEAEHDEDIVGVMSFRARLQAVKEELRDLEHADGRTAQIAILFDGAPVNGKRSIDARFATQAIAYFQGIVTRLYATSLLGHLAQKGKIKDAQLASLQITGVATGSFGFTLEESDTRQLSAFSTPLREVVEQAAGIISEFSQESDDDFLIDVDEISPRVFISLGKFFKHLEMNEASLKATLPHRQYVFDRVAIKRAYERISQTHVRIVPTVWNGTLVGLSPIKRTFDFRREGELTIVSGKFSHQVSQDYLERIENQDGIRLGDKFKATVEVGTIRKPDGSISTSYTATDLTPLA